MPSIPESNLARTDIESSAALNLQPAGHRRDEVLNFIQQQFKACFNAEVQDDTADLYRVTDANNDLVAAFGVRRDPETFFVRHYTGDVLNALTSSMGPQVGPDNVMELNHLSAARPVVLCTLAPMIAHYFHAQGVRFMVCCATARMQAFFARKNLAPVKIAPATAVQLPEGQQNAWGTYYEHQPSVVASDLQIAVQRLCAIKP